MITILSSFLRGTNKISACLLGIVALTAAIVQAESLKQAPDFASQTWLNTSPLNLDRLKGRVLLVEFWTYGCVNCRNVEPYVKKWHNQYANEGLVIVAVHTPEFESEKDIENVKRYLRQHEIFYPVLIDNDLATWQAYGNRAWPTLYLIDKRGVIRHVHVGEGGYKETEHALQTLLTESTHAAP
ncbi:MAG: redoxin family protein [Nitrososphaera sp.]|nr:redoxin family protein [Nitrososphaera sp.]